MAGHVYLLTATNGYLFGGAQTLMRSAKPEFALAIAEKNTVAAAAIIIFFILNTLLLGYKARNQFSNCRC